MKIYNDTPLPNVASIGVRTYYKSPIAFGFPGRRLLSITILSNVGGLCTCTVGEDTFVQTITGAEALTYINAEGYSLTP